MQPARLLVPTCRSCHRTFGAHRQHPQTAAAAAAAVVNMQTQARGPSLAAAAAAASRPLGPSLCIQVALQAGPKEHYTHMGECCFHPVDPK
jgi:hypothetical protein